MELTTSTSQTDDLPAEAIALLGVKSDRELEKLFGVSAYYLKRARISRGIEAYSSASALPAELIDQLGKVKDVVLAEQFGVSIGRVFRKREALKIPRYLAPRAENHPPLPKELTTSTSQADDLPAEAIALLGVKRSISQAQAEGKPLRLGGPDRSVKTSRIDLPGELIGLLGKVKDSDLARQFNMDPNKVRAARVHMGIPRYAVSLAEEALELLGVITDRELAKRFGLTRYHIRQARLSRGIAICPSQVQVDPKLLGTMPDAELAEMLGVEPGRITRARRAAKIPVFMRPADRALLGTMSDIKLAEQLGLRVSDVAAVRVVANIPTYRAPPPAQIDPALLGTMPDAELAEMLGVVPARITLARRAAKIHAFMRPADQALLGTMSDIKLAEQLGLRLRDVTAARLAANIPAYSAPSPAQIDPALLGTMPDAELAEMLGVEPGRITRARRAAKIDAFMRPADQALLGTMSDINLAEQLGLRIRDVTAARVAANIPAYSAPPPVQIDPALLGTMPDAELAEMLGVVPVRITRARKAAKIPEFMRPADQALLGTMSDIKLAEQLGLRIRDVKAARVAANIPAYSPPPPVQIDTALLGTMPDAELAGMLGLPLYRIATTRRAAKIPVFVAAGIPACRSTRGSLPFEKIAAHLSERPADKALLGNRPDLEVAKIFGVSPEHIARQRELMGIAKFRRTRWTSTLLALLGTVSDEEVAVRSGGALTVATVKKKRHKLKIPICQASMSASSGGAADSPDVLALLGKVSDYEISARTGVQRSCITLKRKSLGIPPATGRRKRRTWTSEELALLGNMSDSEIAGRLGLSSEAVAVKRRQYLGEGKVGEAVQALAARLAVKPTEVALLGTKPDAEIASMFGVGTAVVVGLRVKYKIPAFTKGGWTPELRALIGKISDKELAARSAGALSARAVSTQRNRLGIPAFGR
ncbi:hypothetical protein [Pseudomonas guariconensis]|uniref:hypothetical protein n=1 Tax=Pseudomonas guariconensis TaxID=1288410 RepID=UPI0039060B07